jgi:hypothetical protein
MAQLISIETITSEDLDYQQEYHESLISSFETILHKELNRELYAYAQCDVVAIYNPRTRKFSIKSCTERYEHNLENVIKNFMKQYF